MTTPQFPNAIATSQSRPLQVNEVVTSATLTRETIANANLLTDRRRRQARRAQRG